MSENSRNVKMVVFSAEMAFKLCKTSGPRVIACDGIPPDAKIVRIAYDGAQSGSIFGRVLLVVEHESFPPVEPGCLLEHEWPKYTEYYGEKAIEVLGGKTEV